MEAYFPPNFYGGLRITPKPPWFIDNRIGKNPGSPMRAQGPNLPARGMPILPPAIEQTASIYPVEYNFQTGLPLDPQQDLDARVLMYGKGFSKTRYMPPAKGQPVKMPFTMHEGPFKLHQSLYKPPLPGAVAGLGAFNLSELFKRRTEEERKNRLQLLKKRATARSRQAVDSKGRVWKQFSNGDLKLIDASRPVDKSKIGKTWKSSAPVGSVAHNMWAARTKEIGTFAAWRSGRIQGAATAVTNILSAFAASQVGGGTAAAMETPDFDEFDVEDVEFEEQNPLKTALPWIGLAAGLVALGLVVRGR